MLSEELRLRQSGTNAPPNWHRWGPYLSERHGGPSARTTRRTADAWDYFPHDHARSRAYRWGEDGLLGI